MREPTAHPFLIASFVVLSGCGGDHGEDGSMQSLVGGLSGDLSSLDALVDAHHGHLVEAERLEDARDEMTSYLQEAGDHHLAMEHAVSDMGFCHHGDNPPDTDEMIAATGDLHDELGLHETHMTEAEDLEQVGQEADRHHERMLDLLDEMQQWTTALEEEADGYLCAQHHEDLHGPGHGGMLMHHGS